MAAMGDRRPLLTLLAVLFVVTGCHRPLPPDVAPPQESSPRQPYTKGKPAPDVQPEPANPFVRDARSEVLLSRIGVVEGRASRALDEARARKDGDGCAKDLVRELGIVAREARAHRNELREAAFEDPAAEDAIFGDLTGLVTKADKLARDCPGVLEPRDAHSAEIQLTGPLAGSPEVRNLSRRTTSVSKVLFDIFGGKTYEYRLPASPRSVAFGGVNPQSPSPGPSAQVPPPATQTPAASPYARGAAHDASMLIRSAQLALAVFEVDKKMEAVQAIATELGGYLALRRDREVTVRVPREHFDEALRRIESVGDVLHRSVAAEDVTDQYVDLELRLKNAQAVRARLEKLLETASVKDAVEIHKELTKITEEVERLSGKLKLLKDRIAFSTITVTFERTEPQKLRSQALLPFTWMRTMGLGPLLQVSR
jgi:hypothetical protein